MKKKKKNRKLVRARRELSALTSGLPNYGEEATTENTDIADEHRWMVSDVRKDVVVDVLVLKQVEKAIGRPLTYIEVETARQGEPLFYRKTNGVWESCVTPIYKMPGDVQLKLEDLTHAMVVNAKWKSIFKYGNEVSFETH